MTAASPKTVRAELADALDASRLARETAERELHRSIALRSRAAVLKAQEFERAASVVASAFEAEATSASPLAAALLQLVGSKRGGTTRRGALASGRTAPAARVRSPRPRTA